MDKGRIVRQNTGFKADASWAKTPGKMRLLTLLLGALGAVWSCRGREESDPPEDPDLPADFPPRKDVPAEPLGPFTVHGESVKTEEQSSTVSGTSIEFRGQLDMPAPQSHSPAQTASTKCCRTCRTGRACGNTCIAADRVCHAPPGCACDD